MNNYGGLLRKIARELNILQGDSEPEESYKSRIVYSAVGYMSLASLYDVPEDDENISVQHFKKRAETLYDCYLSMYPELKRVFMAEADIFSGTVYDIFLKSGCIYHAPNRITASAFRTARSGQIIFARGTPLNRKISLSGLGAYLPANDTGNHLTVPELFCLHRLNLSELWRRTAANIRWNEINPPANSEYLRKIPSFSRGYFKEQPDKDGKISILRTGTQGAYLYYFYEYRDGKFLGMQIPSWQAENGEYRLLSNSCINSEGSLPPSVYHSDNNIVRIELEYLYPPSVMNMIKLYSWPESYNPFSKFRFIMPRNVFFALKRELEGLGYSFREEK